MESKNLHVGIKMVMLIKYWCPVGMLRCENLSVSEFVDLGRYQIWTMLILGCFIFAYVWRFRAWFIDLNNIQNKITIKYLYPSGIKECEILNIDTWMVSKKEKIR